ncbi:NADH-cytochrome b5 reductase-like isoform X3 [Notamacropus eugenii]|uniref:NADH-cytochrome b5 reductase-like isoform X3 n=1 Tax=Notamacropus eugenii TaxID=9315 RepID=UPI003B6713A4
MRRRKPGFNSDPLNLCLLSAVVAAANPAYLTSITRSSLGGKKPEPRKTRVSCGQKWKRGTVDGLEIQRAYTPISHGSMEGYFEVLIKCYETGLMSQYVKAWKVGDTAFWRGPFGGFPYRPNQYGELLMLAAGTGLAPMLPILKEITDNEEDETFITLVGCFKTFESIYLKPFLQDQARYWNVRTFFVLSQEASLNQLPWSYQEKTHLGRLSQSLVRELVSSCRRKPFALVCGPSEFVGDMALYLQGAGLSKESYFLF